MRAGQDGGEKEMRSESEPPSASHGHDSVPAMYRLLTALLRPGIRGTVSALLSVSRDIQMYPQSYLRTRTSSGEADSDYSHRCRLEY